MFIRNLIQIGEVYQFLCREWANEVAYITIKNDGKVIIDNLLVCTKETVDEIYKYLLENWTNGKVQIFYAEEPQKVT